jgi:hypothetical protein
MKTETPTVDDKLIWDIWLSSWRMPSVRVADELGIFDALALRPQTYQELASELDLSRRGLKALLPMLAALGLLEKRLEKFVLADSARWYLVRESSYYWGAVFQSSEGVTPHYEALRDAVSARDNAGSADESTSPASGDLDSDAARQMTRFMHSHSGAAATGLARNGEFADVTRLLDVGGGSGVFSIALAARHPALTCTVLDLKAVCDVADEYAIAAGVSDRVNTLDLDMFEGDWPDGYDATLFSNVFHDWDHAACWQLARKAYESLPGGGRIYIHEMLLHDSGVSPLTTNAFSILMLVATRGQQFTFGELKPLLEEAGFSDISVEPTYAYYSVVTGHK